MSGAERAWRPKAGKEAALAPSLPPEAEIVTSDRRTSPLTDGDYDLVAEIVLGLADADGTDRLAASRRRWRITVRGPRYQLGPDEIATSFPPPRSQGAFQSVLPHVVLTRPTLPWERSGHAAGRGSSNDTSPTVPWLALVALGSEDVAVAKSRVADLDSMRKALGTRAVPESGDESQGRLIDLSPARARDLLPPDIATLHLCHHVRRIENVPAAMQAPHAVVVAHRPLSGSGVLQIHLVSVEGLYDESGLRVPTEDASVTLVSLHSWECSTKDDAKGHFSDRAARIRPRRLGRDVGELVDDVSAAMLAAGAVPLAHERRDGVRAAAWYHGPLVSRAGAMPRPEVTFPVQTPDDLLVVDARTGLLDTSYAAAWELGRLMLLSRPKLALALGAWKRARHRFTRTDACCAAMRDLPTGVGEARSPDFPLEEFFGEDLDHLRGIPFGYLVPDPAMLPEDTLATFDIDPLWIRCLKDGAFSLGRATKGDHGRDAEHCSTLGCLADCCAVSGVLLRSSLVADWPDLVIDGFAETPAGDTTLDEAGVEHERGWKSDVHPLEILRSERLAPHVALVLFAGRVRTVELHLHPRALHFELPGGATTLAAQAGEMGAGKLANELLSVVPRVRFLPEKST